MTFTDVTVGQGLVHQTRVGIVTYAANASVYAPLSKYGNTNELYDALYGISQPEVNDYDINILQ